MSRRVRVSLGVAGMALAALAAACGPADESLPIALEWRAEPTPLRVGPVTVEVTLTDTVARQPLTGARMSVEANMSHPGMSPSLAQAEEVAPGRYAARLDLTMGGDWYLLFDIELDDGRRVRRQVDVPGVRTKPAATAQVCSP